MSADSLSQQPAGTGAARDAWVVVALLAAATLVGHLLDRYVSLTTQAMLYVLAVVVASYTVRVRASLVCAVAAVALLNFFFITPRFTFQVDAQENVAALVTLLTVALVVSQLGTALRRETEAARLSERRAGQLLELATDLASATLPAEIHLLAQRFLNRAFPGPCLVGLLSADGTLNLPAGTPESVRDGMRACIREAATLGPGTGRWPRLDAWYLPLKSQKYIGGAACVPNVAAVEPDRLEHAQAICALVGQALGRLQLTASMQAAEEQSQWHRAQNTFLAAVSHDFRTPLAAIVGAASSLQTQHDKLGPAEQRRLAGIILDEAAHLATLTENTLQLVRLDNAGELNLDWQSMEEIVGSVLARVRQRDTTRRIHSRVPPDLPLLKGDPVLLTQLLENLLDNALKYSADTIELVVSHADESMEVAVHDRGNGIPAGEEQTLFEPYRRNDRSGQRGTGLGLAVCRAIARAHGGALDVRRRPGGGSSFILKLPVEAQQPAPEVIP